MPPGSATDSNRAATFTPSPWMSSASTMMSPRLTPTRNTILWSSAVLAFRSRHATLHSDRTGDGLNDTRKFDQDAVAGRFDDAAFVLDDLRINEFPAMRSEPSQGASLVLAHQPLVTGDIGSENGSEPALDALSAHMTPPWGRQLQEFEPPCD